MAALQAVRFIGIDLMGAKEEMHGSKGNRNRISLVVELGLKCLREADLPPSPDGSISPYNLCQDFSRPAQQNRIAPIPKRTQVPGSGTTAVAIDRDVVDKLVTRRYAGAIARSRCGR